MTKPHENAGYHNPAQVPQAYEIRVNEIGFSESELDFEPYLFQRPEHLATQRRKSPVSIGLWNTQNHRIAAVLHLDRTGAEAVSPSLAPFGGIQAIPNLPAEVLKRLLEAADDWCRTHKAGRLIIRTSPEAYDESQSALLKSVYVRCGFLPVDAHVNHHIRVTPTSFGEKIHPSERRRLRKCLRAGFTAEIWQNPDPVQVYAFLAESRQRQGYPLSLDFDQLHLLLTYFSHQAQVFVVKAANEIISLTLGIRVNSKILYNFCPADNLDYRSFSPMVLLNSYLYEYAQSEGIELIDLGVSLDHLGNAKASLMRFKENLGAERSEKVTYGKVYS